MRSAVARLIRSSCSASPSRLSSSVWLKNGEAFSSDATPRDSTPVDKPSKVEEAEPVKVPPPSPDKLLVLGGSGFVGSHVCKEALDRGFVVSSLNSGLMRITKLTRRSWLLAQQGGALPHRRRTRGSVRGGASGFQCTASKIRTSLPAETNWTK